jgi:hypothetical protein
MDARNLRTPETLALYAEEFGVTPIDRSHVRCTCGEIIVARREVIQHHLQRRPHAVAAGDHRNKLAKILSKLLSLNPTYHTIEAIIQDAELIDMLHELSWLPCRTTLSEMMIPDVQPLIRKNVVDYFAGIGFSVMKDGTTLMDTPFFVMQISDGIHDAVLNVEKWPHASERRFRKPSIRAVLIGPR